MNVVTVVVSVLNGVVGLCGGLALSERRHRRSRAQVPSAPAKADPPVDPSKFHCGCGHNYAFHDLEASKCCAKQRTGGYLMSGNAIDVRETAIDYIDCPCRRYTGPKPPVDITAEWNLQFGHLT